MESTNSLTESTVTIHITHGVFITGLLAIERTSSLHSDHVAARSAVLRLVRSRLKFSVVSAVLYPLLGGGFCIAVNSRDHSNPPLDPT
jgi:hypothetical protein